MPRPDYSVDIDLGEPPPELQDYARIHCGEDPNTRLQAIEEFRDLIYERGECNPHRFDDNFLVRFLRAREFVPQRAHRLMVNYYRFRDEHPELFENIYPMDLKKLGETKIITVPPYRDQDGRRLVLYRIGCWDPKVIPVEDLFKGTLVSLELGLLEARTQILGGVAILDLEDIAMHHAWQVTPTIASNLIKLLVTSFPTRTYAIHIINHSWVFDKIYNMFKPLLNSEMQSRIFFHGYEVSSLHKHIHPDHLPERYGGVWPEYPYTIWLDSLKKNYAVTKEMLLCGFKFREEEYSPDILRRLQEEGVKCY